MQILLGLVILQFGLGLVLAGVAGRVRQDAGGSFWAGVALSALLGLVGFWIVVASARRASRS
ncbi:MAG TPA: hypothetical protein VF058_11135 [Actinomycetota bacterium]